MNHVLETLFSETKQMRITLLNKTKALLHAQGICISFNCSSHIYENIVRVWVLMEETVSLSYLIMIETKIYN
jgi:hypothetical protein